MMRKITGVAHHWRCSSPSRPPLRRNRLEETIRSITRRRRKNLAGTFPFEWWYSLAITSPSSLNDKADIGAGITADLRVIVDDFPETSTEAAAAALVTLDDQFMVFNALAQTHQTTVRVRVSSSTIPGDYVFTIQADGPNGIGWGNGGHTLTVTVAAPGASDTTPPAVVITSPTDGQKFTVLQRRDPCTGDHFRERRGEFRGVGVGEGKQRPVHSFLPGRVQ